MYTPPFPSPFARKLSISHSLFPPSSVAVFSRHAAKWGLSTEEEEEEEEAEAGGFVAVAGRGGRLGGRGGGKGTDDGGREGGWKKEPEGGELERDPDRNGKATEAEAGKEERGQCTSSSANVVCAGKNYRNWCRAGARLLDIGRYLFRDEGDGTTRALPRGFFAARRIIQPPSIGHFFLLPPRA